MKTCSLLLSCVCTTACLAWMPVLAGETFKVPVTVKTTARPEMHAIEGPLPRPILMVKLEERGEYQSDPTVSSFWVFDPSTPEKGLHKFFSGPGQDQDLRFITPLFCGYGLATGRMDPEKKPQLDRRMFWFNPLEEMRGPVLDDDDMRFHWWDGSWMVGEHSTHKGNEGNDFIIPPSDFVRPKDKIVDKSTSRIVRYDPLKAIVQTTELDFTYINWLDRQKVLGVAKMQDGERIVHLNVENSEFEILGKLPEGYHPTYWDSRIVPAGVGCRDGIYAISDFSLWFLPRGETWHQVIRDVHIVKTFGGRPPSLPVCYLGNGRFALAKTVKDSVKVPRNTPKDERMFGAAEAVSMLVDGRTGEVLKQSEPFIYSENPYPKIPDDWWAPGLKPKAPEPEHEKQSLFHLNQKKRSLRFANDKVVTLGKNDEKFESSDGRYLLIYQSCPGGHGKAKTRIPFRILDAKTGETHSAEVTSDFYEAWVQVTWETLCPASPDPQTLRDYQNAGPGPN